ncbi:dienelactone hydrolase family protein [Sphingomonas sp. FW199]|uniref:dienelactone hydrolase family protein n=1 Tax=Sphingomonas sp. FW199 TaxID=3400217 RepID=UPI003CF93BE6
MCDRDMAAQGPFDWAMNRRQFAALGAGAAIAACAPVAGEAGAAQAGGLSEGMVSFPTADGTLDAFFVRPASGRHAAVITWPDIAGVREAFRVMARRLAAQGHAVLVINPYYRDVPSDAFKDFAGFAAGGGFQKVGPWRAKLTPEAVMRDANAAIAWLDKQPSVDTRRGIGSHGYCMGGPFTVFTAAAQPGRVKAAVSLHGGGLVRADTPMSPHKILSKTDASYHIAVAQNDDAKAPGDKTEFKAAADAAGRPATVEVYAADHGWTVIDSAAYNQTEAERAWAVMSGLFKAL